MSPRLPVAIPITVMSKRVPWVEDIALEGPNYSGATFRMELRQNPGDTGTALVTLTNAAAGSQGISATYNAAYVDPETTQTFAATVIVIQIDETTMEGLASATPSSSAVELHYDIHVTPSGGVKFLLCGGAFTYYPGVTI
jgi:hypothetical protein